MSEASSEITPETIDISEEMNLLKRGLDGFYSENELARKLRRAKKNGTQLRIKLGMDPTAPDIHLGHAVVLRKLRQFQDLGHKAILLIGDYTAKIGDPTGRDSTRPILDDETIKANAQTYLDQAGKILLTDEKHMELRYNSEWLSNLSFADVLKLTGKITVQQMLHRENFKKRMADETEIMVSEFMYPLMQAYDSVALKADVELGGTDQTFNNLMGRQLMEKEDMEKQVVMVLPILVGLDGTQKMSKSKGNYVGLTFAPNDMFGKVMSIPDNLMQNYFELLTSFPEDKIKTWIDAAATHPREAKDILAQDIVTQYHDEAAAKAASDEFKARFTDRKKDHVPSDAETHTIEESPIGLLTLICKVGFATSNGDARRRVQGGGVKLDTEKVTDPRAEITLEPGKEHILQVGKKQICKVKIG